MIKRDPVAERPVFAFTIHRSGGTLLGRLLNCHPDLVVWGEHSGLVNNLAEMHHLIRHNHEVRKAQSGDGAWLERFTSDTAFRSGNLQPWTMPPHLDEAKQHARNMIRGIFTQHIRPGQRWGFKEIRYHRPHTADYLLELFPGGRFVLLSRDVADAAVSNILSSWSQGWIEGAAAEETEELANEIVRDVVYALLAFQTGFKWIKVRHPGKCFEVNYSSLRNKDTKIARDMLEFLGLKVNRAVEQNITKAFSQKFNKTVKVPKVSKILTADFIRKTAEEMMPDLQAEIHAKGVDRGRLVSTVAPGKYSFLVGTQRSAYVRL